MSRIDCLHADLASFSRRISDGEEPIVWFNACKAHALDHLGEDKALFPRIQVHLFLTVYTYMHVKFCSTSPRNLDALRAQLSEWSRLDDLAQLIIYPSISRVLLGFLGNCAARGHQCDASACTEKLMDQDLIAAAAFLEAIIRNPEWKSSLLSLDESKARPLLSLMHKIMDLTDLDEKIRSTIYQATIRMCGKSKSFPECMIQRDVTFVGTPAASGKCGDIWRGEAEGRAIAIKVIRAFAEAEVQVLVKIYTSQAILWDRLRHPNILPFYGVHRWKPDPSRVCLISPWMDYGDIVNYLNMFPNTARLPLLYDVALGLEYLHTRTPHIVHSDLKGSNILITSSQRACIADFDLSVLSQDSRLPLNWTQSGRGLGSLPFLAPEILDSAANDSQSCANTLASDIYSYGCVCYEVFAGRAPFAGIRHEYGIILAVVSGKRPSRPPPTLPSAFELDDETWNLITRCWHQYAEERPSVHRVAEILSRKMTVTFTRAPDWDDFRMRCSCVAYKGWSWHQIPQRGFLEGGDGLGKPQPNEQVISQSSSGNLLSKILPFVGVASQIASLSVNPESSKSQRIPDVVASESSQLLGPNITSALDDEVLEAAFVACWPRRERTTSNRDVNKAHVLATLGDDKTRFSQILVGLRLMVYTYMHVMLCSIDRRGLDTLQAQISEWNEFDAFTQLSNYHLINRKLLDCLRNCASDSHQCAASVHIKKLLDRDLISAATLLVFIFHDEERTKTMFALEESKTQAFIALMHHILDLADMDSGIRSAITLAIFTLSTEIGCFPECLVLHDVAPSGLPVAGGAFGDIWKGQVQGRTIAIKVMRPFRETEAQRLRKIFASQAVLWERLHHPNILPFYGIFLWSMDPSQMCLISPWMDNGNINQYLTTFPNTARVPLLYDVALGLRYLHSRTPSVIHSDLKGSNILITSSLRACIADFDLSTLSRDSVLPLSWTLPNWLGGSLRHMAPELLGYDPELQGCDPESQESRQHTLTSDIYAYACVCYEVFVDKPPFLAKHDIVVIKDILDGTRPPRPPSTLLSASELDDAIWDLMSRCWHQDPGKRPPVHEVVAIVSQKMTVEFKPAPDWNNFRKSCSCAGYDDWSWRQILQGDNLLLGDGDRCGEAQVNEQKISPSSGSPRDDTLSEREKRATPARTSNRVSALSLPGAPVTPRPPWCTSVKHLIRGATEALRILETRAEDFERVMLAAQVDRYAVQAGFFESEDGTDFLLDVQEIAFYIVPTMEAKALHLLADSLAKVGRPVIVSVHTPENEAFAWFDAQGKRVTDRDNLPDVWRTDSSADIDERIILFRASLPGSLEHSLPVKQADSTRQCPVQINLPQHGDGSTDSSGPTDVDSLTQGVPNASITDLCNDANVPIEEDAGAIPAVAMEDGREIIEDPRRKAFTICLSSIIITKMMLHVDGFHQTLTDEFTIGLEMTAIWAKTGYVWEMLFEMPKTLESATMDVAPKQTQDGNRVHFLTAALGEDRKPVYCVGTCTLNVFPTMDAEHNLWHVKRWEPDVEAEFERTRTVSQAFKAGFSLSHIPSCLCGFMSTTTRTRNTNRRDAQGGQFKKWIWETEDEGLRQTGRRCERLMVEFYSQENDEPQTEVKLTCRRIRNKHFLGKIWGSLHNKFRKPGPIFFGLKNLVHDLVLVINWREVPPCEMDDAKIPRFPLLIRSDCAISGEPIFQPAFGPKKHAIFQFATGIPGIKEA